MHTNVNTSKFTVACVWNVIKIVCAPVQDDGLLLNYKLIHSDIMEGSWLPVQVGAAVSALCIRTAVAASARLSAAEVFVRPLSCRLKQPALSSPDGGCQPCPISSTGPVCGSDGRNYASKVNRNKCTSIVLGNNIIILLSVYRLFGGFTFVFTKCCDPFDGFQTNCNLK